MLCTKPLRRIPKRLFSRLRTSKRGAAVRYFYLWGKPDFGYWTNIMGESLRAKLDRTAAIQLSLQSLWARTIAGHRISSAP